VSHTPGPWRWELNIASKQVRLVGGKVKYDLNVMDFVRYGMGNAAPRFNVERRENLHLMTRADELGSIVPGREHHAEWFQAIDHPDANLIAAAPKLQEACKKLVLAATENDGTDAAEAKLGQAVAFAMAVIRKAKGGSDET
jgi:hypothetical protein